MLKSDSLGQVSRSNTFHTFNMDAYFPFSGSGETRLAFTHETQGGTLAADVLFSEVDKLEKIKRFSGFSPANH